MLNTDGNIKFVDAPYIRIRDEVKVEGRQTKRTLAWDVFKDTISELEKKENTFKTIVVDLLEDLYEHCRLYMYQQMGITHESDDSFRAWDKVRGEFLNTLKRLMNLDYENIILISHEDTSKDITKRAEIRSQPLSRICRIRWQTRLPAWLMWLPVSWQTATPAHFPSSRMKLFSAAGGLELPQRIFPLM